MPVKETSKLATKIKANLLSDLDDFAPNKRKKRVAMNKAIIYPKQPKNSALSVLSL